MAYEGQLEQTEWGLLPVGEDGWFVLNAREARWRRVDGLGAWPSLEGSAPRYEQLGVGLHVLQPGEPNSMYHWETDQEDFLVLAGEAVLIVEGQERPLQAWDFVHCPPGTQHVIVGAGDGPCLFFAAGSRQNHTHRNEKGEIDGRPDWGAYTVCEAARRLGACVEEETTLASVAYARFAEPASMRYPDGYLPDA